ncbi:MAG: hypothetical protein ACRDV4_04640 [Acidimicrobiales bacterium]
MADMYRYVPHHRTQQRIAGETHGPVTVADQLPRGSAFSRFNSWLGLKITVIVGTMVCAYVFAAIALISLPDNVHTTQSLILWISSSFLQLVLLPIIIVGQNVQARASDKRAEATYKDADAVLHEAVKIQEHLAAQDALLTEMATKLAVAAS